MQENKTGTCWLGTEVQYDLKYFLSSSSCRKIKETKPVDIYQNKVTWFLLISNVQTSYTNLFVSALSHFFFFRNLWSKHPIVQYLSVSLSEIRWLFSDAVRDKSWLSNISPGATSHEYVTLNMGALFLHDRWGKTHCSSARLGCATATHGGYATTFGQKHERMKRTDVWVREFGCIWCCFLFRA